MVITRRTLRGLLAWRPENTAVTGKFGVRASLIAIVLVPSLALLAVGVGAAAYLVAAGRDARQWAELASGTTGPAVQMVQAFQEERRLSVLHIAGEPTGGGSLIAARQRSNGTLGEVKSKGQEASRMRADFATDIAGYDKLYALLPDLRAQIDSRKLPVEAVKEAIAYCESNPPELLEDYAREQALMEASGMNDPNYKYHPSPKILSPQEIARINRS